MLDSMGLEELYKYKGQDETPKDFIDFWQKEVNRCKKQNITYKMVEKDFQLKFAQCYDLYFESVDSSVIYSKVLFPKKNDQIFPVLFYFHGYQGQSPDWSQVFHYVAAGVGVVMMDVRGQAGKSVDASKTKGNTVKGHIIRGMTEGKEHLFYKKVFVDIVILIQLVSSFEQVDSTSLLTQGESQGGALALVAAALHSSIKKVFAVYPFLSDYKRVLDLKYDAEAYDELHRYFKFVDPFYKTAPEIFQTLGYIDVKNFASMIKCPVTIVCGLQDEICPPSTQFAIYNRLRCKKEMILMPEYGHEAMNVKYPDMLFNWVTGKNIN